MQRAGWLTLLAALVLSIAGFWFWDHLHHPMGNQLLGDAAGQLLAWGRLAGLLAAFGCLLQIILIGRVRWVERAFGLDRLTRLHHVTGFSLAALLIAHPVLVTCGHARQEDVTIWAQFYDFVHTWPDLLSAAIGAGLLLVAIGLSVAIIRRGLRYETWYVTHLAVYLALALAFGHQIAIGSDVTGNPVFRACWLALYAVAFLNLLGFRVLVPWLNFQRHGFVVGLLTTETADVTSVHLQGRDLGRFRAEAGQFVMVRFLAPGFRWEAHPFSISQPPDGKQLRLTIKRVGDFTRRIPLLSLGTRVIVDGPHGLFTARRAQAAKVLMIAGGIGITPIRSVAEVLLASGREIVLIYANRDRASAALYDELAHLAASAEGRLRVIHVMSADPDWPGEKGRVDGPFLARLLPDLPDRDVYLCGPPPMMRQVRAALRAAGVPEVRIFDERFAL